MKTMFHGFVMVAVVALCATNVMAQSAGPTVTTDQVDYAPGNTATITVTGCVPGEILVDTVNS